MIDIHSHFLPQLDDGAGSWDEFLQMCRISVNEGISHVVMTPHMMPDGKFANRTEHVLPRVEEARQRLQEAGIDLTLLAGGEIYISPSTALEVQQGRLLTYGGQNRYVLIELPTREVPLYAQDVLFQLQLQGVTPILAHPERYLALLAQVDNLEEWIERGILLQVNARSLLGESGEQVKRFAEDLLRRRMVHFLASDAHGVKRRPPGLKKARDRAGKIVGPDIADALVRDNPAKVLEGLPIQPWEIKKPQRRGLIRRILRR